MIRAPLCRSGPPGFNGVVDSKVANPRYAPDGSCAWKVHFQLTGLVPPLVTSHTMSSEAGFSAKYSLMFTVNGDGSLRLLPRAPIPTARTTIQATIQMGKYLDFVRRS